MSEQNIIFDQILNDYQSVFFPWESSSEQRFLNIDDFFIKPIQKQEPILQTPLPNNNESEQESKASYSKTKRIKKEPKKDKNPPESSYTKNVCYNICQKTIKIISDGEYQDKLEQICSDFDFDAIEFENTILKKKKDFTGPKALKYFIDEETIESKIFAKFMKWFLENKYLRHALKSGEMKNIEAYITYKNEVLLNILN